MSLCLAREQQKLLSSPRFDVSQADFPKGPLLQRIFFSQTPVFLIVKGCERYSRSGV